MCCDGGCNYPPGNSRGTCRCSSPQRERPQGEENHPRASEEGMRRGHSSPGARGCQRGSSMSERELVPVVRIAKRRRHRCPMLGCKHFTKGGACPTHGAKVDVGEWGMWIDSGTGGMSQIVTFGRGFREPPPP